jgi:glycine betaine/choline ABC-type transport system substrate-binding protein
MTTEELTRLGVEVAVDQKDVADVAREWLTAQGLL